ncbi:hypothetical protein H6G27_36395 [Nostoc linckia FACHB-104]|nr:hypothetical protein [Nostoc linckia FACHB-104]
MYRSQSDRRTFRSTEIQCRLAKGSYRVSRVRLRNDCGFGRNTEDTRVCLTERGRGNKPFPLRGAWVQAPPWQGA